MLENKDENISSNSAINARKSARRPYSRKRDVRENSNEQELEQKNKIQLEKEKLKKEEKRKKEIYKNQKFLEFQKKIIELGLNGDGEDNPANERNNYYNLQLSTSLHKNQKRKSRIMSSSYKVNPGMIGNTNSFNPSYLFRITHFSHYFPRIKFTKIIS